MSTDNHRETAKIYQFPAGGRAGLAGARETSKQKDERFAARAYVAITACGSWYHEEAIQEADPDRKR